MGGIRSGVDAFVVAAQASYTVLAVAYIAAADPASTGAKCTTGPAIIVIRFQIHAALSRARRAAGLAAGAGHTRTVGASAIHAFLPGVTSVRATSAICSIGLRLEFARHSPLQRV